jgi:hypothetical protein
VLSQRLLLHASSLWIRIRIQSLSQRSIRNLSKQRIQLFTHNLSSYKTQSWKVNSKHTLKIWWTNIPFPFTRGGNSAFAHLWFHEKACSIFFPTIPFLFCCFLCLGIWSRGESFRGQLTWHARSWHLSLNGCPAPPSGVFTLG